MHRVKYYFINRMTVMNFKHPEETLHSQEEQILSLPNFKAL